MSDNQGSDGELLKDRGYAQTTAPPGPTTISTADAFREVMLATIEAFGPAPRVSFDDWQVRFNQETIARGFKEMPEAIVLTTFRDNGARMLCERMVGSWGYAEVRGDMVEAFVPAFMLIEANRKLEQFKKVAAEGMAFLQRGYSDIEKEASYRGGGGIPAGGALNALQERADKVQMGRQSEARNQIRGDVGRLIAPPQASTGRQYFASEGGGEAPSQPSIAGVGGLR